MGTSPGGLSNTLVLLLCLGVCALAFGLGRATSQGGGAVDVRAHLAAIERKVDGLAEGRADTTCPPQSINQAALLAEIQRLLKASSPQAAVVEEPHKEAAAAQKTVSPAAQAALDRGQQILDAARARHVWGEADAAAFRNVLPQLDGDLRLTLLTEFSKAANLDEFKVETSGPPF
jgi:hypothetical protein